MKRKHTITYVFLMLILAAMLCGSLTVQAENAQKVVDLADILSDEEEAKLQEQLYEISEKYQCDVVAATSETCGAQSVQDYTDDFYYQNGYGYGDEIDGIILMICMEEREFHYATRGEAMSIFTDYGLECIDEMVTPELSEGDYYEAFSVYGRAAEEFIQEYTEGGIAYDTNHTYEAPDSILVNLLISGGIGLFGAVVVLIFLFGQLKTVAPERRAQEYVRSGSFHLMKQRDIYLYKTVTKREKPKQSDSGGGSSTHSTSDGGRAGGRSGSF